jgi:transcriptional regulator with XRE-family HTH domain
MKNFGEKLKALRQEQNLTQEQLAKKRESQKQSFLFGKMTLTNPKQVT